MTPWWETLKLRPEVIRSSGQIDDVQMSLFQAVHGHGRRPPAVRRRGLLRRDHPPVAAVHSDLLAKVAVRLGGGANYTAAPALWRLDQAMGGGKSHGLIGLYHLAASPGRACGAPMSDSRRSRRRERMIGGKLAAGPGHARRSSCSRATT